MSDSDAFISHAYGWQPSPPDFRDLVYKAAPEVVAALPPKVDLTEPALPAPFEPTWDQGPLGACGAFTSGADIAFAAIRQQGLSNVPKPSTLFIYYAARQVMGTVDRDSGVNNRAMLKALAKYGWCDEANWPYSVTHFKVKPPEHAFAQAATRKIVKYESVPQDLDTMKAALAAGDPFIFGFSVYSSMETQAVQRSGVIPMPNGNDRLKGGHDVLICFTGDTKVPLLNGKEFTLKELANGAAGDSFWVYSCDSHGNVVPGRGHSARMTGKKAELVKVTLDNGEEIRCTPNHQFLMRDGTYREASTLQGGDSLMPLYREVGTEKNMPGYERLYNPATKKWQYTHRRIAASIRSRIRKGTVIHHADFDKRNNAPDNLVPMTWEAHTQLHAKEADKLREYAKSPEGRAKSREIMAALWADPEWRAEAIRRCGRNGAKSCLRRAAEGLVNREACSRNGKLVGAKNIAKAHTPEAIAKRVKSVRERIQKDPEFLKGMQRRVANATKAAAAQQRAGLTDAQREARRQNMKVAQAARLAKNANNHKVVSVEACGHEDVYDITVDVHHNFALSAGVFVHNCGYDDSTQRFKLKNSWGGWGNKGYGTIPYAYATNPRLAGDFWTVTHASLPDAAPSPSPDTQAELNIGPFVVRTPSEAGGLASIHLKG